MLATEINTEGLLRNVVAAIPPTLRPGAMVGGPVLGAILLPGVVPLPAAWLLPSALLLPSLCLLLRSLWLLRTLFLR
ncbi:MAG TPA: hypothetical protein VKG25_03670 [Bryobacteraceae bacterium]|nr:hypothetical protein [Bryobacteraceae bacterium]